MKRILMLLAVCLSAIALLAGCGSDKDNAKDKGHLKAAVYWFGESLDPAHEWDGWTVMRIGAGETLTTGSPDMKLEPTLADSWELVSPTQWKFHIREGVKFQNGDAMTPELVKASLERTLKENVASQKSSKIASIRVEGQNLIIDTSEEIGALPAILSDPAFIIVNTKADVSKIAEQPVLTGPYTVVEFKKNDEVKLKRNENYWNGKPKLEKITVKNIEDDNKRAMALQSGDIDLMQRVNAANRSLFEKDGFKIHEKVGVRTYMFAFDLKGVLGDNKVRTALVKSIDYNAIAAIEGNGAVGAGRLFPASTGIKVNDNVLQKFDKEGAKKLLEEAGYTSKNADGYVTKDGKELALNMAVWGTKNDVYETMQQELKDVGIKLTIKKVQNYEEAKKMGGFDLVERNWITLGSNDPAWFLNQTLRSTSPENYSGYTNPAIDVLLDKLVMTPKVEERFALASEIQNLALVDNPNLYLLNLAVQVVGTKHVKNVPVYAIDYYFITKDIELD